MARIENILLKINQLNPIPSVVHQVLAFSDDLDSSIQDLVKLVEHDPAITANLLKICNSAHMGLPVKVDSVHKATSLLGGQRIVELVLDQKLGVNLQHAQKGYQLEKGQLWRQSVAAAMVSRTLAQRRQLSNLPSLYTAALLKDIGKVVLNDHIVLQAANIRRLVENRGISFIEAEKACIGMDHAHLGGLIARQWKFSSHLIFMIENHHLADPNARRDPATATIYLADMIAMLSGASIGVDRLAYPVYESLFKDYFLAKDEIKAMIFAYEGFLKAAEHIFEVDN